MPEKKAPSPAESEQSRIADAIRESDKLIRAGRYLVADELLQQVLTLDPGNESARSYQDRIQFLIKQLSQRPGLSKELVEEIRKYSELLVRRKVILGGAAGRYTLPDIITGSFFKKDFPQLLTDNPRIKQLVIEQVAIPEQTFTIEIDEALIDPNQDKAPE